MVDNEKRASELLKALERIIRHTPTACGGRWNKKELQRVAIDYLAGLTEAETYARLLENRLAKYHGRMSKLH